MVRGDLRAVMNAEDGWTIHNAYEEMHDAPTAWAMLQNPHDMGCY